MSGSATAPTAVAEVDAAAAAQGSAKGTAFTMGLVGGLLPSPSALILLLGAIAVGQQLLGLVLVVAFGLGMAVTLATVGLLATQVVLRMERLAVQRGGWASGLRTFFRYGAAVGICVVGAVVAARAVGSLL